MIETELEKLVEDLCFADVAVPVLSAIVHENRIVMKVIVVIKQVGNICACFVTNICVRVKKLGLGLCAQ